MPKILFLDSYYPQVLTDLPITYSYEDRIRQLGRLMFGTSDFYSHAFKKMGWEAADLVVNDELGLRLWGKQHSKNPGPLDFVEWYKPDVLYCQDLSIISPAIFRRMKDQGIIKLLAAQHSCPWAGDQNVSQFDIVFSSFPHYLDRIRKVGPKSEFLQIGFGGQRVLDAIFPSKSPTPASSRPYKISFVGGIGGGSTPGHWSAGTMLLRKIAENFPTEFQWWGYGSELLTRDDPLSKCYKGMAWGSTMYRVYADSSIVVNRHGEVAEGYFNNMRNYEATGLGSVLFTEDAPNLSKFFRPMDDCVPYSDKSIVFQISHLLNSYHIDRIATNGFSRTMKDHTYDKILVPVEETFTRMLNGRS